MEPQRELVKKAATSLRVHPCSLVGFPGDVPGKIDSRYAYRQPNQRIGEEGGDNAWSSLPGRSPVKPLARVRSNRTTKALGEEGGDKPGGSLPGKFPGGVLVLTGQRLRWVKKAVTSPVVRFPENSLVAVLVLTALHLRWVKKAVTCPVVRFPEIPWWGVGAERTTLAMGEEGGDSPTLKRSLIINKCS